MPKGKGKKGGKKKKVVEIDPNALTEVDKTFYELTITDLNRKLARLRAFTTDLEERNEDLVQQYERLNEDRSDIISYLKRKLDDQSNQITELQERITALQETREAETEKYEEKIKQMSNEYRQMHEQLTSDIKLLQGKLNSLEEFRLQREDLMSKFETQEQELQTQETRHKRELYEIERKFIISKDAIKKDMEARLMQLSTDFQHTTELRVAATTHRVIRENIAVNNELDIMLTTQKRLYRENQSLRLRDKSLQQNMELSESEKTQALLKTKLQTKIIEDLTGKHKYIMESLDKCQEQESEFDKTRRLLKDSNFTIKNLNYTIRLLEQNLHSSRCERTSIQTNLLYFRDENERLADILFEATSCIKEALSVQQDYDYSLKLSKRESLLSSLFTLLNSAESNKIRNPSLETVSSMDATYSLGDLGFVPKPVVIRSKVPTKRHMDAQTGSSLELVEEASSLYSLEGSSSEMLEFRRSTAEVSVEEEEQEEEEIVEESEPSSMFFNEEELLSEEEEYSDEFSLDDAADMKRRSRHSRRSRRSEQMLRKSQQSTDHSEHSEHTENSEHSEHSAEPTKSSISTKATKEKPKSIMSKQNIKFKEGPRVSARLSEFSKEEEIYGEITDRLSEIAEQSDSRHTSTAPDTDTEPNSEPNTSDVENKDDIIPESLASDTNLTQ